MQEPRKLETFGSCFHFILEEQDFNQEIQGLGLGLGQPQLCTKAQTQWPQGRGEGWSRLSDTQGGHSLVKTETVELGVGTADAFPFPFFSRSAPSLTDVFN